MLKRILTTLSVIFAAGHAACVFSATALETTDDGTFITHGTRASGWTNIQPAVGGSYVHSKNKADEQPRTDETIMLGKPSRQYYDAFTASEQEAIWNYRHQQQVKLEQARLDEVRAVAASKAIAHKNAMMKLNWPRVVLRNGEVCVPSLDMSDSPDWKDYLLCTHHEVSHVGQ